MCIRGAHLLSGDDQPNTNIFCGCKVRPLPDFVQRSHLWFSSGCSTPTLAASSTAVVSGVEGVGPASMHACWEASGLCDRGFSSRVRWCSSRVPGCWVLSPADGGYGIAVFILFCKADGSDVSSCVWCVFGDRAREECCRAVPAAGIQGLGVQGWGATGMYVRHGHTGVWLSGAQRLCCRV